MLQDILSRSKLLYFVKTSRVYVRDVPPGHMNTARFGEFVESNRASLEGEVLCMNPEGGETWFTDGKALRAKTVVVGAVVMDGVVWEVREPTDHPSNRIGAIRYMGWFGEELEFYKPVWGTTMRVASGGWIAVNLEDHRDIWSIDNRAMHQLYRPVAED